MILGLGFILSLVLTCVIMPFYIKALKNHNINQSVSEYALGEFKNKAKTPIMGGLIFVVAPVIIYLIINGHAITNPYALLVVLSYCLYCVVGFWDDLLIIIRHNNEGLSPKFKLALQIIFAICLYLVFRPYISNTIAIPFTNYSLRLPSFIYLIFMVLLYGAESNAVNFTDGMDGLCAGVSFIALIPFLVICCLKGHLDLAILIACVLGGLIGYLFFNFHPAKIFMGDSGSLALGGLFASLSIVLDNEIALFVIGGVFVIEMFCVVVQQLSVRIRHKRVFSYTPIHYAFTIKGYKEAKVVTSFYLLQLVLSIIGLYIGLH